MLNNLTDEELKELLLIAKFADDVAEISRLEREIQGRRNWNDGKETQS